MICDCSQPKELWFIDLVMNTYTYIHMSMLFPMQAFLGIGQFIVVVVASIVIGLLAGMAGAFFTRFTEHVHGERVGVSCTDECLCM